MASPSYFVLSSLPSLPPSLPPSVNMPEKLVYVSRVKPVERKGGGGGVGSVGLAGGQHGAAYRRTKAWQLGEVRVVDGKSTDTEVPEFDLHVDKTMYKWIASSVAEKKSFLSCIFKVRVCVCVCGGGGGGGAH